ncbi:MAG: flagellar hook capping FlgD N-terminal domain-containing protein [Phycisphaerae bacterium]|nr:flagellar hook capping FlgD N-terminal domain-containing protein [Phycisphaerae bacterium]
MDPVSAISGNLAPQAKTGSSFSDLSSEEFVKILFTELANQDPFKPNDSGAMLEQLNSIRSIESDTQMMKQLESVVAQNQFASAGGLMGQHVQGLTEDANRVSGKVVSVAKSGDSVGLLLDNGWVISMENVEAVLAEDIVGR